MPGTADETEKELKEKAAAELFLKIGLDERTAKSALANTKVTSNLYNVIHEAGVQGGCNKAMGNLLYMIATKYPANALKHRPWFLQYVTNGKVKSIPQLEAAFLFFSRIGLDDFDPEEFEKQCGVGVEVTLEEIKNSVEAVVKGNRELILAERYRVNVGLLLGKVRRDLPWADGKVVKEEMDTQLKELLGEKTEEDEKPTKKKKEKVSKAEDCTAVTPEVLSGETYHEEANPFSIFPDPRENIQVHTEIFFSDGTIWRPSNSKEKLEKHLSFTGGKIFTRFPPEPNGYLHIGHAKKLYFSGFSS